ESEVEQLAANHFNRAELFRLQFKRAEALPHYEKAHQYRPDNLAYGFGYALALQNQNNFIAAMTVYVAVLQQSRDLVTPNPDAYRPTVPRPRNTLATRYRATRGRAAAKAAYKEALATRRALATRTPAAYRPAVAETLNNLALLYHNTQRLASAEAAYKEALG